MGVGTGDFLETSGESSICERLKALGKSSLCVLDVGANEGQFLGMLLAGLPDSTQIHCFEPSVSAFSRLSSMASSFPRVFLNRCAIGRQSGEGTLHYDREGSGLASLTKRDISHVGLSFEGSEPVQIRTIDEYCSDRSIDRIHLLKLDIEGHELDALQGARGMFSRDRIDYVTFEFGGCNIDTRTYFRDFWRFFGEFQMNIFRLAPRGAWVRIERYEEFDELFRTTNFVASRHSA
jgi:FkbM family methyltransferase